MGLDLLYKVFDILDIVERDYFGILFIDNSGDKRWLEAQKTLAHQFKKLKGKVDIYFQFKFYPIDPMHLKNEFSR